MFPMISEASLLSTIQTATQQPELLEALLGLATVYIETGRSQEGADVLAYLLVSEAAPLLKEQAQDIWDDLATWVCPRVLLDAADFGRKASLADVVEYVLL